jgi:diguanylate cyclase (GGDEF)-like protein
MTTEFPAPPGTGHVTRQDISGAVTSVIVRYVRGRASEPGVHRMLELARETRPAAVLEDPTSWSSHDEAIALFDAARIVTGDSDIGRHVGEEMLRQHDGTEVANLLRSLGSPGELLRNVAAAAAKFTTVATTEPLEVGDAHAVVRVTTRPGFIRHPTLCEFTKGLLSQVPVLFGLVPAVVAESECQARGGRFCLYSVAWEAGQWSSFVDERSSLYTAAWNDEGVVEAPSTLHVDEDTRIGQLESQVAQLTNRLEGVYSTAADLLATDDIDGVLARITARAAHAVNAPRYLLVVQTAPGMPHQLHQHGFSEGDASALARELLEERPDDRQGSRLIVDIASSHHHYGRLAAVYPEGMQFFAREQQILGVYADYAASALDVVTALDEARRSNDTARALLDFSRALSLASAGDEVTRHVVETVPVVVECESAAILLWDPKEETLVFHANTASLRKDAATAVSEGDHRPPPPGTTPAAGVSPIDVLLAPATRIDGSEPFAVRSGSTPFLERLQRSRDVIVMDRDTNDPLVKQLLMATDTLATIVAPLFAAEEFLGVVTANFHHSVPTVLHADRDRQVRLAGLADQAATALQNVRLLEKVSHLAWHDTLTGLPNRRLLEDRVNQELNRAKRSGESISMFFIDLDRFKQVNDTLGHAAGDDLIQQVAQRLCDTVRRQDTVARLGGDEFAVLLPGLSDPAAIDQLARRALDALGAPYLIAGQEVYTSGSIGIATTPQHGETYDELLSNADAAMYRSKGLGRNTFQTFGGSEGEAFTGDVHLETDLHHAIERGELFVLYQPFIDLETTSVVGVEALARWHHPVKGIIEPNTFIPIAEESDLIVAIDTWMLQQACRQIRHWSDNGLPLLRVAVNVSTRDLASDTFVRAVVDALHTTAIDPSALELEVTERVVMDDAGIMRRHVEYLMSLGVRFSIDDFGSGNSTLSRIASFPVSTLKIDQSFVQILGPKDESSALVTAIISMAHNLGIDCIAEGVETSHQSRVLLQRGCTTAQGFFFSPPLLPNDVERMLNGGEVDPPTQEALLMAAAAAAAMAGRTNPGEVPIPSISPAVLPSPNAPSRLPAT